MVSLSFENMLYCINFIFFLSLLKYQYYSYFFANISFAVWATFQNDYTVMIWQKPNIPKSWLSVANKNAEIAAANWKIFSKLSLYYLPILRKIKWLRWLIYFQWNVFQIQTHNSLEVCLTFSVIGSCEIYLWESFPLIIETELKI